MDNKLWYKNIQLGDLKSVNLDINETNLIDLKSGDQFVKTCVADQNFLLVNTLPKNFRLILTGGSLSSNLFITSNKRIDVIIGIESISYYDSSVINIIDASILESKEDSISIKMTVKPTSIVGDIDIEARDRITNLENNETIYEIFKQFTSETTAGAVYIPEEATIFDVYGDGQEDIFAVVADENNNPTEEFVLNSSGDIVLVTSFDSSGNFTLDSTPTKNYCLVYFVKIADIYKSNVDETKIIKMLSYERFHSVGIVDVVPPTFTNNSGDVTIESSNVGLRSDSNHVTPVEVYNIPQSTLAVPDLVESYLYADYNTGNPIYKITANVSLVNGSDSTLIYVLWRVGNTIHSANQDSIGLGLQNKINSRILNTEPYKISRGTELLISETSTPVDRTITCTDAVVFKGVAVEQVFAYNSSVDPLVKVIKTSGGTWTYTTESVYNNTTYNPDGLGEVVIPSNKWVYRLYYRSIGDDKEIFYVMSKESYTSIGLARDASLSARDIPIVLSNHCLLVGRSLIQEGFTTGTTEPFINRSGYYITPIPEHNDTLSKQGGTTDEYYHLTSIDYTDKILNRRFGSVSGGNYTEFESTGFLKKVGSAKEWVDIDFPIIIRITGVGIPTSSTLQGNITAPQWSVNDFNVCEGQELIHGWTEGTEVFWHIHVITNGLDVTDRYLNWEIEYTWLNVNSQLAANAVITNEVLIPANTPDRTMLIMSIGSFVPTGGKITGHVFARLRRLTSVGLAPTNNPFCSMLQLHVLCDTTGSRNIGTK